MRIVVNKHWRDYLDFGSAGTSVYSYIEPTTDCCIMCMVVKSHALHTVPVYKKNIITIVLSLCIFETTINEWIPA